MLLDTIYLDVLIFNIFISIFLKSRVLPFNLLKSEIAKIGHIFKLGTYSIADILSCKGL